MEGDSDSYIRRKAMSESFEVRVECRPGNPQPADVINFFRWTRVVVLHCDDVYCRDLAKGVERELAQHGIPVHFQHEVPQQLISAADADGASRARCGCGSS